MFSLILATLLAWNMAGGGVDSPPEPRGTTKQPAAESQDPNTPWQPKKGEIIFVSATLTHVDAQLTFLLPVFGGAATPSISELPACVPLKLVKVKPKKELWASMDPAKGSVVLMGPWLPRMHQSENECKAYLKANGEPKVIHSNWKHVIIVDQQSSSEAGSSEAAKPPDSP